MPVTSLHPEYLDMLNAWSRARDVIAGEDGNGSILDIGHSQVNCHLFQEVPRA